jgi:hypothetical protein
MPSPKGNKFAIGDRRGGRHSQFNLKFIENEAIADLALECDRAESTTGYLASGRRFSNRGDQATLDRSRTDLLN